MPSKYDPHHIEFRILSSNININDFDCDDKDLNEFLIDDALNYQKQNLAQTTCVFFGDLLVGYFALTTDVLSLTNYERRKAKIPNEKRIKEYPAIKIARMAFSKDHQRKNLGKIVVNFVKGLCVNLKGQGVAVKYITVDAYKNAKGFYDECGFVENQVTNTDPSSQNISMRCNIYG